MKKKVEIAIAVFILAVVASSIMPRRPGIPPDIYDKINLHQIGGACIMFAKEHQGRFPDDWSQLALYDKDISRCFLMWENRRTKIGSMTNVMDWTDYVYVRGATTSSPPSTVVAFLPPGAHENRAGAPVLFADGRVEWQSLADFTRIMNRNPNKRDSPP
jgi:prepilin-type processing-associated H-X9-DG protein